MYAFLAFIRKEVNLSNIETIGHYLDNWQRNQHFMFEMLFPYFTAVHNILQV